MIESDTRKIEDDFTRYLRVTMRADRENANLRAKLAAAQAALDELRIRAGLPWPGWQPLT